MKIRISSLRNINSFRKFLNTKYKKDICFIINKYEKTKTEIKHLYLNKIQVKLEKRRLGYGTNFMTDLCAYADFLQLPIKLYPMPLGDEIKKMRLNRFYKKFGFEFVGKDHEMMRKCESKKTFLYTKLT